jgi:hypothetical protein
MLTGMLVWYQCIVVELICKFTSQFEFVRGDTPMLKTHAAAVFWHRLMKKVSSRARIKAANGCENPKHRCLETAVAVERRRLCRASVGRHGKAALEWPLFIRWGFFFLL